MSLVVRSQSLETQFPSHLFGNVELLMLKKIFNKHNDSNKVLNNGLLRVPESVIDKIGEYLDFSKLSLDPFNEKWKNFEDRFYKMYSYVEDLTGYKEVGIRLLKFPSLCVAHREILKKHYDAPVAEQIKTELTLQEYAQQINDARNNGRVDITNLNQVTAITTLQVDIMLQRAEDSRELSRMGTEFQRRCSLKPEEQPPESLFTNIIPSMKHSRNFLREFSAMERKSSVPIRASMDRLAEQSPSVISQTLVYGPMRVVKKAFSRFRFTPY